MKSIKNRQDVEELAEKYSRYDHECDYFMARLGLNHDIIILWWYLFNKAKFVNYVEWVLIGKDVRLSFYDCFNNPTILAKANITNFGWE